VAKFATSIALGFAFHLFNLHSERPTQVLGLVELAKFLETIDLSSFVLPSGSKDLGDLFFRVFQILFVNVFDIVGQE
jgi:hypothetical protein